MYCGNNRQSSKVRSGEQVIGTRYGCLKKGIGVGMHLPYDPEYAQRFVPIDGRKIYCGELDQLPAGYDLFGSNSMCYFKGVGTGKAIKAKKISAKKQVRTKNQVRTKKVKRVRAKKRSKK